MGEWNKCRWYLIRSSDHYGYDLDIIWGGDEVLQPLVAAGAPFCPFSSPGPCLVWQDPRSSTFKPCHHDTEIFQEGLSSSYQPRSRAGVRRFPEGFPYCGKFAIMCLLHAAEALMRCYVADICSYVSMHVHMQLVTCRTASSRKVRSTPYRFL